MRNEQHGQRQAIPQVTQQIHHLGLDGHIQCRQRLVGNDKFWLYGQRTCHTNTLALPPREFMRITARVFGPQAHQRQQLGDALVASCLAFGEAMYMQSLAQNVLDAHLGVERRIRILKNHLQLAA